MTPGTDFSGPVQHADFQNAIKKMLFSLYIEFYIS